MTPFRAWVLLYRLGTALLPRRVRERDGEEMVRVFGRLLDGEATWWSRVRRGVHGLAGLAAVGVAERWEGWRRTTTTNRNGRTGMDRWGKDLRFAVRTLRRAPAFTTSAVLLLALGIGAVTTVFTLVDHVLLRPLPYPGADRLVALENGSFAGPFVAALDDVDVFEAWAAGSSSPATLTGEGDPVRVEQAVVTPGFFTLFGASASVGRLLAPEDAATADRVVLGHGIWMRRWGGDPSVVGRTLVVDDEPVTVVGVLAPGPSAPSLLASPGTEIWRPVLWSQERMSSHEYHILDVVARLRPGATPADAETAVATVAGRMAEVAPDNYVRDDGTLREIPVRPLQDVMVRGVRNGLGLLLGAVGLLLAVACANVAHLFLARGLGRSREMAVRRALGADTPSLTRQLLVEAGLVGLAGGALGVGAAVAGIRAFEAAAPSLLPPGTDVGVDLRVVGFAAGVSLFTALLFGLLPAARSLGRNPAAGLRGAGRAVAGGGRRLAAARSGLLVAEVALSMVLLAGAGLLMRSFLSVRAQDPGVRVEGLWSVPLTPTDLDTPERYVEGMGAIRDAVARLPEVESAAFALALPFSRTGDSRCCWSRNGLVVSDHEGEPPRALIHPVSEEYFATLGIELLEGRVWEPGETTATPAPALVTASTAAELWGGPTRAVGGTFSTDDGVWLQVVGVVADHRHFGLDQEQGVAIFVPVERVPFAIPLAELAVRLRGREPADLGRRIREAVWSVAPAQPVPTVRSMASMVAASTATRRFDGVVFSTFGVLALLLAAGGLYGTLLYTVGQRRREMGIRMALGADRRRVEARVMAGGLGVAAVGVGVGMVGAWFAGRALQSRLWGIAPGDPGALAMAAACLLVAAAVASWVPARRAARTDPVETLRME